MFVAGAFLLACFGALLLFSGEMLGAWILGFGAILEAQVVLQALRPGWSYRVGPEGIAIGRPLRPGLLPRSEIRSVEAVEGSRVEELLAGRHGSDVPPTLRGRRDLLKILAFASAPVVLSRAGRGGPLSLRGMGASAPGRFVLVTLSDGAFRALSPIDVEGFVAAYNGAAGPPPAR